MLDRSRSRDRSKTGGLLADLTRILALSPSLLIWPANGAGWQGTSGGTAAASGQPLGLGADLSQFGGKTLGQWLTSPTTSSEIASGTIGIVGAATAATYNTGTGAGSVSRVDSSNQSFVVWESLSAQPRVVVVECLTGTLEVRQGLFSNPSVAQVAAGSTATAVLAPGSGRITLTHTTSAGTATFIVRQFNELPGNHLRAGTWASPSDAARGTFQNSAINFDGSSDYYSLLNAINISESMTVVRAFKRASAGITSNGLGMLSTSDPYDGFWTSSNTQFLTIGSTLTTGADTSTGSFVYSSARNASTARLRRNGTQIVSGASGTAVRSFETVGRVNTNYNSGEISFLAVFPTELTGSQLALVEQIAASTNGATLA